MFVFGEFKKKVHIGPKSIYIDNIVFRLHYRITLWFLLGCSVLVGSKEFIKEHINCIADKYLEHVINTYCFFSTTFTVVKYHENVTGLAIHPGVGAYAPGVEPVIRHAYYQWVPFVLFAQALLFYLPHLMWKSKENGRMLAIVTHMKTSMIISTEKREIKGLTIESEDIREKKVLWLKEAYLTLTRFRVNRDWGFNLVLCEILNAVNLIVQVILINKFLQGNFLTLGIKWWYRMDNMLDLVFPKVTKCTFHKYGPTGTVQLHDTICVMPLNIINEKIYCVLWFWFVILFIVTALGLVWRLLTFILHRCSPGFNRLVWGELSPGPAIDRHDLSILTRQLCFSDWLFLYYIGKNINGSMFRKTVSQISETLQNAIEQKHYIQLQPTPSQYHKGEESDC